jgi:flagellar motility protein MotE (MotC chaperone)
VKKLWNVLVLTLAFNFLLVAGGAGYLYRTGRLDREKVFAIRELLFPPPAAPATQPTTRPTTQPVLKMEELLAAHASLPAAEQVALLQRTFDSRMAQLDRREREIRSLHDLVNNAEARLKLERDAFDARVKALDAREQDAIKLAADQGFQESLQLYGTMKPKQVKDVFTRLPDAEVVRYLRALDTRQATKILAEFKTPAELDRVKALMEQVRAAEAGASAKQ